MPLLPPRCPSSGQAAVSRAGAVKEQQRPAAQTTRLTPNILSKAVAAAVATDRAGDAVGRSVRETNHHQAAVEVATQNVHSGHGISDGTVRQTALWTLSPRGAGAGTRYNRRRLPRPALRHRSPGPEPSG